MVRSKRNTAVEAIMRTDFFDLIDTSLVLISYPSIYGNQKNKKFLGVIPQLL
jgi:hypothetical protein